MLKDLVTKLILFGVSFLMFGIAVLQVCLGYALSGKTGHQNRIYMNAEPTKFWTVVLIPVFFGLITFVLGILLVFWRGKTK